MSDKKEETKEIIRDKVAIPLHFWFTNSRSYLFYRDDDKYPCVENQLYNNKSLLELSIKYPIRF